MICDKVFMALIYHDLILKLLLPNSLAGEAYAEETVQPVLHRYNDAKYIWSDTSAREWLDGFVRAHDPTVPQAERRFVVGARARGALDGAHGPAPMRRVVIDLELEEGAEAARPILLD